jgi:hypothetical protein
MVNCGIQANNIGPAHKVLLLVFMTVTCNTL